MSMPELTSMELTRDDAINRVIASIAMEELGLSHIINSEGEKIQYAIGTIEGVSGPATPPTIEELLTLNKSVRATLDSAMQNQILLKSKLDSALCASNLIGPTGPTGPTGPAEPFLSCFAEALGNTQTIPPGSNIAFDADSYESVGGCISMSGEGEVFTITHPGLYQVAWTLNLVSGSEGAVVGVLEDGEPVSGATSSGAGSFSSGTLIEVTETPYTISLHNFISQITIENAPQFLSSAASIRIIRFADGARA